MVTGKRIHKHQLKYKYAKKAGHDEEKTKNIVAVVMAWIKMFMAS